MPSKSFYQNGSWQTGIEASNDTGYRTIHYEGDIGGGHLYVVTECDGVHSIVPDIRLDAVTSDQYGIIIRQRSFQSSGTIAVVLEGAVNPKVKVAVS